MNTEKQIEDFNNTNAPFYVVAHDGRFSLCLPIDLLSDEYYPYCQTAFDNYAKEIGDEVCDERGLKTHGNGYEWDAAFEEGKLTADTIEDIMAKPKANQRETVKFSYERIARFFPPNYSTKQMEDAIVRILEERKREVPHRRDDTERG